MYILKVKKIFVIFVCIIGCKTNSGNHLTKDKDNISTDSDEKNEETTPNTDKIKVGLVTANTFGWHNKKPLKDIIKKITKNIPKGLDIIIVGLQEHTSHKLDDFFKNKFPDHFVDSVISDTISEPSLIVLYKKNYKTKTITEQFTNYLFESRKFITAEIYQGNKKIIKVANTHLAGGRYDDENLAENSENYNVRYEQTEQIINSKNPDIIMGDFNSDPKGLQIESQELYWKYFCTKKKKDYELNKNNIENYLTNPHKLLKEKEYSSVVPTKDVKVTTPFETTVDWIYKKNESKNIEVKKYEYIQALSPNNKFKNGESISDHNFLYTELCITV